MSLWAPVGAFMFLLYLLSARSDLVLITPPVWDKVLHAGAYGMLDEIHQSRVAGRDASMLDWLADVVGAGLSVVVLGMLALSRSKRSIRDPQA